jgi:hypothetical protein
MAFTDAVFDGHAELSGVSAMRVGVKAWPRSSRPGIESPW